MAADGSGQPGTTTADASRAAASGTQAPGLSAPVSSAPGSSALGSPAPAGGIGGLVWPAFVFSVFVNLLMLTGPLFMLQVYDRVLGSRSEETLSALFVLVVFLFLMMGLLDHARGRVLARAGVRLAGRLEAPVFDAALRRAAQRPGDPTAAAAQSDLDAVERLFAAPVLLALFDMPWTPVFLAAVFLFHRELGWLAVIGGGTLIVAAVLNQWHGKGALSAAGQETALAHKLADQYRAEAENVLGLGMRGAGSQRVALVRARARATMLGASDTGGAYATFSRTARLFLQSAILALGAWLVLRGELTAGAMIATSILIGRALAPVEQAVGGWPSVQRAREGWTRLARLRAAEPPLPSRTALPRPRAMLEAHQVSVLPPGRNVAALRLVTFRLEPGQAMGVIGPSGAGKSTLARALTGVWPAAGGAIRLDGATLDQYDPDRLGSLIGYLPQRVTLFDGTIAENIARMALAPDAAAVMRAAERAGAHRIIIELPQGYDTPVSALGCQLSGGQIQRVGLARALYGEPVLLVLDEPNSNLDNDGSQALNAAIRAAKAEGASVLIMAHRPAAIAECELLLVLENGARSAFGPRDEVLRGLVRNSGEILRSAGPGGVA